MNVQQVGQTYGGHNTHGCTLLVYSKSATHTLGITPTAVRCLCTANRPHTRWASHPRLYAACVQQIGHTHAGHHTHGCTLLVYSKSATHTLGITPTAVRCLCTANRPHTHAGHHTHGCTLFVYSQSATHTMGNTPTAVRCLSTANRPHTRWASHPRLHTACTLLYAKRCTA